MTRTNCGMLPAAGANPDASASAASSSTPPEAARAGNAANSGATEATTPCPPAKKIVRQGGASDPNIQLAGGPGGQQASQERATANQMLGATEENLKKIAGRKLSSNQQDVVNQIHQFMEQSKTATAAGDLNRARTLAWKAQMLSEELAKPADK
ncbi:MAG TPA: hypothetical protein VJ999_12495 [Candidatus Sulfotelmatobacter sp.]|nr:hypothetical protein [Candidatus Sulfotelmatobacter sp.]